MAGDENERKSRDPIFTTCLVIFVVAAIAITAVYVNDNFIQKDDRVATVGDTVYVNYTGSYFAYIGEDGAVVFDTSYENVAKDDKYVKANEFSKKSSYSTFEVTIGSDKALSMFEDAIVGLKVGEKVKVMIPADKAYVGGGWEQTVSLSGGFVPVSQGMTKSQFVDLYSIDIKAGSSVSFTTVYGWPAIATLDGNTVVITNMPEVKQYTYTNPDKDAAAPSVTTTFTVTSIADGYINITNGFSGELKEFVKLDFGTHSVYVTGFTDSTFTFKIADERVNEDLYFEIELVSFKE